MAISKEGDSSPAVQRRRFLALLTGWAAVAWTSVSSAVAAVRFLIPNVLYEPSSRIRLGKPDQFPEGATFLEELRVFILRKGNSYRALSAICTHLGCTVNRVASGEGYFCPCHGSRFDANGAVTSGPAPRPLYWRVLALTKDGRLLVDLNEQTEPDKYLVV